LLFVLLYFVVPSCQQVWSKRLNDGSFALAMVNYAPEDTVITCDERCLTSMGFADAVVVRDVWAHKDLGTMNGGMSFTVGGNGGSLLFKLSGSATESNVREALQPK
jgi:hypothetical protein